MRDHGGNLDWAMARFGGSADTWVDLSTGINRVPYPVPELSRAAWCDLPTAAAMETLRAAARAAYGSQAEVLPMAGAQAAIQAVPLLRTPGQARVLGPTYNEHAAALVGAGWAVTEVRNLAALEGAEVAVVVNPNNPTGAVHAPAALADLARTCGMLVVDESFGDVMPEMSLAAHLPEIDTALVLRSFGKFFGLAGLRLGFALGHRTLIERLAARSGPWPVSGAAIEIGRTALADRAWADATRTRLRADALRMDALAQAAGFIPEGGTSLFRFYTTPDAARTQEALAHAHVWSRIFPWSATHMRLGLPGSEAEWDQVEAALLGCKAL